MTGDGGFSMGRGKETLRYVHYRDFMSSIRELNSKGGKFKRAADTVLSVLEKISRGEDPFAGLQTTNFGERRIAKCIKYDLTGHCRLITVQDQNLRVLCYVGDHQSCDEWLGRNRGFQATLNDAGRLLPVFGGQTGVPESRPVAAPILTYGPLYEKVPQELLERFLDGISPAVVSALKTLESVSGDDQVQGVIDEIAKVSIDRAGAALDILLHLRADRVTEARDRLKLALHQYRAISEAGSEEVDVAVDGQTLKTIPADSPQYVKLLEHFAKTADYRDWMLFMHPDQERIARTDFVGPAKLSGVSGSGKTCIVVQRAVYLAAKYPSETILVLTLNRPLAGLIHDLVMTCAPPDTAHRITVKPFFAIGQELLRHFEPRNTRLYDDITWKSHEHIDEIWREYYRCELNNGEAAVMQPVHDSLTSRGIDAEVYLREEFDWIRSAVPPTARSTYLGIARQGRTYPLDESMRQLVLDGLEGWERKMKHVGITDYLGIAKALYTYRDVIKPIYRCVLVDECQDFGTNELALVRRLVTDGEDDLFLVGDAAQHVTPKHQKLGDAGINVPGARSLKIMQNYRNSKEILRLASVVLNDNLSEEMLEREDFEILDPAYANFSGPKPACLEAIDLEEEIASAIRYLEEQRRGRSGVKYCIAVCGFSIYEIQAFGNKVRLPVLDRETTLDQGWLFLSDLEQTKGFEFDCVCILNVREGVVPNPAMPERERFRDLSRFYVAMTRAKLQLVLSFSHQPSSFISGPSDLVRMRWAEYLENPGIERVGIPPRLNELRMHSVEMPAAWDMTGEQFLYTRAAKGLSLELIGKIRELIPGKRTRRSQGGRSVVLKWRSFKDAYDWFQREPLARQQWGPAVGQEFQDLTSTFHQPGTPVDLVSLKDGS